MHYLYGMFKNHYLMKRINLFFLAMIMIIASCENESYDGKTDNTVLKVQVDLPDDVQFIDFEEFEHASRRSQ